MDTVTVFLLPVFSSIFRARTLISLLHFCNPYLPRPHPSDHLTFSVASHSIKIWLYVRPRDKYIYYISYSFLGAILCKKMSEGHCL